jgi:serine/threonine-protein kinase
MSAIQTEPDRRPRTAGTMARELRAWLARHPVASADAGPPTTRLPAAPTVPARLDPPTPERAPPAPRPAWVLQVLLVGVIALLLLVAWLLFSSP